MPSIFSDPRLDELLRYWQERRGDRPMPARADIRPTQMGSLLRLLNLIEVEREPMRFRHRLVGSETIQRLGRDSTGRLIDESLYGPAAAEILDTLRTLVQEARPYRRLTRLEWNNQPYLEMESVELPLGENGTVCMILRGSVFRPADAQTPRLLFEPLRLDQ